MTESRRLRTQAERDADGLRWQATADTRPGYATYPDSPPGSPCWWARASEQPPERPSPEPRPWTGPDPMRTGRPALFSTGGIVHGPADDRVPLPLGGGCVFPRSAEPEVHHGPPHRPPHLGPKPPPDTTWLQTEPAPRRRWWHRYTRRNP